MVVFSDSSFGKAEYYSSQRRYLIVMVKGDGNKTIIQYISNMCRSISRIVMRAGILALVASFDDECFLRTRFSRFTRTGFQSIFMSITRPQ